MGVYERALRPVLFRIPAERAHRLTMGAMALAGPLAGRLARPPSAGGRLARRLMGLDFPNPLGLAAGLDKHASAPGAWPAFGFGFAEIGTVTAFAQPGNPPPRLFRLPDDDALINRMGFNNDGAATTARRLERRRPTASRTPLGVNLGKSKRTPADRAPRDYAASLEALWPHADYVVVNVSSPNTPGLRDLQAIEPLGAILDAVDEVNVRMARARGGTPHPVLVKLAPDLADFDLDAVVDLALDRDLAGVIVANTTVSRAGLRSDPSLTGEAGGLSGRPLRERRLQLVGRVAGRSEGRLTIIGVGGVFDADDLYETLRAGAHLVQAYTGFVYGGPGWPRRVLAGLVARMDREGIAHIGDLAPTSP